MNRKQRAVLILYAVTVLVLGVGWVPWKTRQAYRGPVPQAVGAGSYAPIFSPPSGTSMLDTARLGAELLVVTLATGALVLAFREP